MSLRLENGQKADMRFMNTEIKVFMSCCRKEDDAHTHTKGRMSWIYQGRDVTESSRLGSNCEDLSSNIELTTGRESEDVQELWLRLLEQVAGRSNMDYSYLNQAGFDASSCSLTAAGMDPTGLGNMPCSYGDLTSCSQMSQAAYRYTAAAASMARSYNPGAGVAGGAAAAAAGHMAGVGHHHPGAPGSQCAVMGSRPHHQEHVHHRAPMIHPRATFGKVEEELCMLTPTEDYKRQCLKNWKNKVCGPPSLYCFTRRLPALQEQPTSP
ncbi:hypothetical protein C0J52_02551 [Blattella germanica]|nr:hypothetical protein C0J52_02551 [Blattella germanica]